MPLYNPAAPPDATYITQTANGTLTGEQALGALATGLLKNTTGTGVQSIGVAGTDYQAPGLTVLKAGDTMTGLLTYAQPGASDGNKFYCVDPNDPDAKLFNWYVWESNNVSGRRNTGINWGYNQTAGGAVETGGEAAFWQQVETYYVPGAVAQMEYHWNFTPAGGSNKRPFHLNMHIDGAGAGYHDAYWYLDRMTWLDRATQTFVGITLTLDTNAAGSLLDVNIPSTFGQQLSFDGTTHAGLKLNNLTTTQKNALTPAAGMLLYDTTLTRMQGYIAGAWATLYSAGGTDVAIADGGTGQGTAQAAIDALSNVAAATNEHVLTKDTATGNAIFKAAAGGSSLPVADTQTLVMGSADNTKLFRIEVDGFTAGATRVMTPPNVDFTPAGLAIAQTFTADNIFSVGLQAYRNGITTNVTIGGAAGNGSMSGGNNILLGAAGQALTSGANNVFMGQAGTACTTGSGNFALGNFAMITDTDPDESVAIGSSAMQTATTVFRSVGIGTQALVAFADRSVGIGYQAGFGLTTGEGHTLLGYLAGDSITTGTNNVIIGNSSDVASGGISSAIALGILAIATKNNQLMIGGSVIPVNEVYQYLNTALTTTIQDAHVLSHHSTGTPAGGFGTALLYQGESTTTVDMDMVRLAAIWDVATHASRSAALRILISNNAGEVDAAKFDDDATAGNTRLLLYDVDNGQLERVSVGIADSGGAGFKLLRIAN